MPVRRAADPPAGSSTGSAIAVIALAAMTLAGCGALRGRDVGPESRPVDTVMAPNALVVGVVDGDTIDVDVDGRRERVRLIGIDTPETLKPDTPVECYGPEATARAADLLPEATPVRLERDVEPRDTYGRLLAYVYRAADGMFVNLQLVAGGFARPLPFEPNTAHAGEFASAAATAQSQSLGLWEACTG